MSSLTGNLAMAFSKSYIEITTRLASINKNMELMAACLPEFRYSANMVESLLPALSALHPDSVK